MLRLLALLLLVTHPALAGQTALSADGRWRARIVAAPAPPDRLEIRATADNSLGIVFTAIGKDGTPSRLEGVYTDPTRRQFIVMLADTPEYWLVATDPEAPPVYEGFIHSHEQGMIEALPSSQGLFARERVLLEGGAPLQDMRFGPDFREMTGLTADRRWQVTVNLYVNREIARVAVGRSP